MSALGQPPLSARRALKATLRQKASVMRMWLSNPKDTFIDDAFVARHMRRLDEQSTRILRRWKAIRLVWERDGYVGDPPWQVIESVGKSEIRT